MTSVVDIDGISKSFGSIKAVENVTLTIEKGAFFGLLGPNGAGKTTAIRILLDIYKPDKGTVHVFGGPMNEAKKNRIGYMPEERGLYQDLPLERVLAYFATLKGMPKKDIRSRLDTYLERFDLKEYRRKKVKELSKGMQQKAQLIATLIHQPELLIIDEPFSGLDPVNTQMVKTLLYDLNQQGTTIIMSTHQMHQVEELCQRILLMNHGRVMLYGQVQEIRKRFSGRTLLVRSPAPLPDLPGVVQVESQNGSQRLTLSQEVPSQDILRQLVSLDIPVEHFEVALPSLDEIFIRVVQETETIQPGDAPGLS